MGKRRALVLALAAVFVSWGALGGSLAAGMEPVLGLDLQGGFSVRLTAPEGTDSEVLDKAVEIMRRRIEALGNVQEPEIAVAGENAVTVQLPGVTDRDRALSAVGSTGELSFRQVLSVGSLPGVSPIFQELGITPPALTTTTTTSADGETTSTIGDATTTTVSDDATTTTVSDDATTTTVGDEATTTTTIAGDATTTTVEGDTTTTTAPAETTTTTTPTTLPPPELPDTVDPETGITIDDDPSQEAYLLEPTTGIVYHVGPALLTGADISGARAEFGGGGFGGAGQWQVDPDFTSEGGDKFQAATAQLASFSTSDPRRRFAIVLDGEVVSAPIVAEGVGPEGLSARDVRITIGGGENQQTEAEDLATTLRYGALPATFTPDRVEAVSATLGSDSLRAGLIAGIGGLILVGAALLLYYRALGLVAIVGLSVFASLLIFLFSFLGETQGFTLTLAGVTGIVVSVGITSDSYIVYFERIKEEVRHGRSLRAAVDNGFKRAFRTILTADAVTLFGAVLLFLIAVGAVKGFAVALGLATLIDVAVAYFFTRPAAAYLVRTRLGEGGAASIRGATGQHVAKATA